MIILIGKDQHNMSVVDSVLIRDAAGDQALVTTAGELQVLDSQALAEQKELAIIAEAIQELVSRLDFKSFRKSI